MNDAVDPWTRDKLIRRKEQWARENRSAPDRRSAPAETDGTAARVPKGQHKVRDWPVLDLGSSPVVPQTDWSLSIEGLVERPTRYAFADLEGIPRTERTVDIHCVTFWTRLDNTFTGVSLDDILAEVRPRPEARFVLVKSYDGYSTNLPVEYLREPDSLLATHWNGAPLTRDHGGPVRLVIPALYFWKSAKWVRSIRFMERDIKGFWESRGYHMLGDPWREQRYSND